MCMKVRANAKSRSWEQTVLVEEVILPLHSDWAEVDGELNHSVGSELMLGGGGGGEYPSGGRGARGLVSKRFLKAHEQFVQPQRLPVQL